MDEIRIGAAALRGDEVEIAWRDGGAPTRFPLIWLADHDHAPESLHPDTGQRLLDTAAIPPDLKAAGLELRDDGALLTIAWQGGRAPSRLPARFLHAMALAGGAEPEPARTLWSRRDLEGRLPTVPHEAVMDTDDGLRRWLEAVERYGFGLVAGTPATPEATRALVERVGYIRHTIFGGFWDFTANMAFKDTAYTTMAIGPHTDGTYSNDPPGLQLFHCLAFGGSGGESTLVDGFRIADILRQEDPEAFALLTTVGVTGQYLGDGVHLRATHPIIGLDAQGRTRQVACNNLDRAPFLLPPDRMRGFYRALSRFHALANDPALELAFRLEPGTVLLFDNWRTLHGRRAYTGHRRLCGAYLNKEDFDSRLRMLRGTPSSAPRAA
ncbi:MAG: trimethyllysine dioxygenase [Dongiaceae bacterium]